MTNKNQIPLRLGYAGLVEYREHAIRHIRSEREQFDDDLRRIWFVGRLVLRVEDRLCHCQPVAIGTGRLYVLVSVDPGAGTPSSVDLPALTVEQTDTLNGTMVCAEQLAVNVWLARLDFDEPVDVARYTDEPLVRELM